MKKYGLAKNKAEESILQGLTNKLIEVGKWPNLRRKFTFTYQGGSNWEGRIYYRKNNPRMSNIEAFTLIAYYIDKLEHTQSENTIVAIYNRGNELLDQVQDVSDRSTVEIMWWSWWYGYFDRMDEKDSAYACCISWLFALTQSPEGPSKEVWDIFLGLLAEDKKREDLKEVVNALCIYSEELFYRWQQSGETDEKYAEYADGVYNYAMAKMETLSEEYHFVITAYLQLTGIVCPPKRTRVKQGTFDYCYSGAEEGDKEAQLIVARAYREGEGVPQNIRLADFWEGVANNKFVE